MAIPLGVSKIFDVGIVMNYKGKTFSRDYDVTSGPIDTKLNNSFIAIAFIAFLYCTNTTGTGSCSSFRIGYKKLALVSSFQSTNFHSNRIIGCKDIAV